MTIKEQYQKALNETIAAYEKLIADPEGELLKWKNYGRLCRFCTVSIRNRLACGKCPVEDCSHNTMTDLKCALSGGLIIKIKDAAIARLNWIKAKAKENGYKV